VVGVDFVPGPDIFWVEFHIETTWNHWSEDKHAEVAFQSVPRDLAIGCSVSRATCASVWAGDSENTGSAVVLGPTLIKVTDGGGAHLALVTF
jgi:hypothetical protein